MDENPRRILAGFIRKYGTRLIADPARCEGLLRDTCSGYPREVFVLVHTLRQRVPAGLLASQGRVALEMLLPLLVQRMQDQCAFDEGAARWGVESWAIALGLLPSGEEQGGKEASPAGTHAAQFPASAVNTTDISAVEEALRDPDPAAKLDILRGLRNPHDRGETGILIRALGNESWQVRLAAFEALVGKGEPARDQLIIVLSEGGEDLAWRAAIALGAMKSREAVPSLVRLAQNSKDHPLLRSAAVWALGEIGDPGAADAVLAALNEPDPDLQSDAEEAIRKMSVRKGQP
jgi:hypothetical protein